MPSAALVQAPAAPHIPEHADSPRIVPHRRLDQRTAAVADAVLRGLLLTLWPTGGPERVR